MKVDIVAGNVKLGEVDVYASSWTCNLPRDTQLDLDQAILQGEMVLELKRKE